MEFKTPSYINNAIIDIVDYNNQKNNIAKFISEVDILGCEALQIRSYTYFDQFNLGDLISLINKSNISYIELVLKYKNL
nr:hypothetical protein [Saprospiraceae bacterium]